MAKYSALSQKHINTIAADMFAYHCGYDALVLFTSAGTILGTLSDEDDDETDLFHIKKIGHHLLKSKIESNDEDKYDIIFNGTPISLEDVLVIKSNNEVYNLPELVVYCDDIVAFTPVRREDFIKKLNLN